MSANRILAFTGRFYADRVTAEATLWWHEAIVGGELRQLTSYTDRHPSPIGITYAQQEALDRQLEVALERLAQLGPHWIQPGGSGMEWHDAAAFQGWVAWVAPTGRRITSTGSRRGIAAAGLERKP